MSIQGISGTYVNPALLPDLRRPAGADEAGRGAQVRTPTPAPAETRAPSRTEQSLPADAPAGTDPALWSVLTSQERAFFSRARSMGPVTYGPGRGSNQLPAALLGGRLDVKV